MLLAHKKAIVTGGSMGLGLAIAHALVAQGASVVICARDAGALERAKEELETVAGPEQQVAVCVADVADDAQVENLFGYACKILGGLDILVNNAGVYGPIGPTEEVERSEWRRAVEINLFGTLYACQEAIKIFKAQKTPGKIINLSGGGATAPLPNIAGYAASKAAVVRLTETLAEEVRENQIDINAIAPGALNTRLMEEVLEAGPAKVGDKFFDATLKQQDSGGTPLEKGALLSVYLASNESDGITGKLISAVWDSWGKFNEHRGDIEGTDVYTLRRIVPKERGMDWETL